VAVLKAVSMTMTEGADPSGDVVYMLSVMQEEAASKTLLCWRRLCVWNKDLVDWKPQGDTTRRLVVQKEKMLL